MADEWFGWWWYKKSNEPLPESNEEDGGGIPRREVQTDVELAVSLGVTDITPLLLEYPMWYLRGLAEERMRKYYADKYYDLLNSGMADGAEMGMVGIGSPPSRKVNEYRTEPQNAYKQLRYYEKIAWPERFSAEEIARREQERVRSNIRKMMMDGGKWGLGLKE